jgi:predicted membrane metal-binding protein
MSLLLINSNIVRLLLLVGVGKTCLCQYICIYMYILHVFICVFMCVHMCIHMCSCMYSAVALMNVSRATCMYRVKVSVTPTSREVFQYALMLVPGNEN